ncbi:MAG: MFS transporter [Prevotella sp.]|nr:MFS transporter [Prevotella sp.]
MNKVSLMVGIASVLHFLVDALCLCCVYLMADEMTRHSFIGMVLTYNVFAFLTQPVTGFFVDKMGQKHWMLLWSMVMLALSVFFTPRASYLGTFFVASLLGMGNSMFHVWGGKQVAVKTGNDIRALGVFVAPGAVGLTVGIFFHSWLLVYFFLLSICLLGIAFLHLDEKTHQSPAPIEGAAFSQNVIWQLMLAVMVFVVLRAYLSEDFSDGLNMEGMGIVAIGIVSMLGKVAGGWIAKGIGILKTVVVILLVVLVCYVLGNTFWLFLLLGLFAINCTMPVTLYWANVLLKGREGFAFGLLAAALILGHLVDLVNRSGLSLSSMEFTLFVWIPLIATILIEYGVLRLLGERRKKVLFSSFLINTFTNVPLNLSLLNYPEGIVCLLGAEVLIVFVEALCYRWLVGNFKQAFAYSLFCNLISFLTGVLLILVVIFVINQFRYL